MKLKELESVLCAKLDWSDNEKVNNIFKYLFKAYHKNNKFPYSHIFDMIEKHYPKEVSKHFRYRKDKRSLGDFAVDMYDGHLRERRIAEWWLQNYGEKYFSKNMSYECVGIDDTGCILLENGSREDMKKPDYLIKNTNTYLEIKSNPCDWKITLKLSDINHYLGLNSYILIACSKGKFETEGVNCSCFILLSPEQTKKMISDAAVLRDRFEVGNKPCIQFYWGLTEDERKEKIRNGRLSEKALELTKYCEIVNVS